MVEVAELENNQISPVQIFITLAVVVVVRIQEMERVEAPEQVAWVAAEMQEHVFHPIQAPVTQEVQVLTDSAVEAAERQCNLIVQPPQMAEKVDLELSSLDLPLILLR
jgi:hypothetical protein